MRKKDLGSIQSRGWIPGLRIPATALMMVVIALPAWASLGGDSSTIQADQVHMQGTRSMSSGQSSAGQSYTVQEIRAANGTAVREYLSPEGKVFALAWNGPRMPDLRQLLGGYFEQYRAAVQAKSGLRMTREPVLIDEAGLVVQIGGRVRSYTGRAYIPEMLPQGVRAEEIQ